MNELQVFTSSKFGKFGILMENDHFLFPATDSARMLGYEKPHDAVARHCPYPVKRGVWVRTGIKADGTPALRKTQKNFITEGDLYRLIVHSKLPAAVEFEHWVFDDMLPAIRKHGAYATPAVIEQALTDPDSMIRIFTALKDERARRIESEQKAEALTTQLVEAQPKIQFADDISVSHDTLLIREFAKLAKNAGYPMGGTRMWSWLREQGIIMKTSCDPYQQYLDGGWFVVEEDSVFINGFVHLNRTTRVTGLGQVKLMALLRRQFIAPIPKKRARTRKIS